MANFLNGIKQELKLNILATLFFVYMYFGGFLIVSGLIFWLYTIIFRIPIPFILEIYCTLNLIISFIFSIYGSLQAKSIKYSLYSLIATIPINLYLTGTMFYYILFRPKSEQYDVIKKPSLIMNKDIK